MEYALRLLTATLSGKQFSSYTSSPCHLCCSIHSQNYYQSPQPTRYKFVGVGVEHMCAIDTNNQIECVGNTWATYASNLHWPLVTTCACSDLTQIYCNYPSSRVIQVVCRQSVQILVS